MQRQMLKSKIHRATVTACDPEYVGVTYALEGEPGSGKVPVNGAAARLVRSGGEVSS